MTGISGQSVLYSELSNRTGVAGSGGITLGGRIFLFVESPIKHGDQIIYSNGESTIFRVSDGQPVHSPNELVAKIVWSTDVIPNQIIINRD